MPSTCAQCGMFDGHFAGCPTFAVDRELERRRQEREQVSQRAEMRRRAYERAEREVRGLYEMGGAITAVQMQAMVEARVEVDVAQQTGEPPERVNRLRRLRDEIELNARRLAEREPRQVFGRSVADMLTEPNEIMADLIMEEAPRTSRDIPMGISQRHTVSQVNVPGEDPYQCSCGWRVSEAYLRDMAERDVRGLIDAHVAGGDVGPKPVLRKNDIVLFNMPDGFTHKLFRRDDRFICTCGKMTFLSHEVGPHPSGGIYAGAAEVWMRHVRDKLGYWVPVPDLIGVKKAWETPELSEPAIMPRRHFNLELES